MIDPLLAERDLGAEDGRACENYRRRVPKLVPGLPRAPGEAAAHEVR